MDVIKQNPNLTLLPGDDINTVRRKAFVTLIIWEERININEFKSLFDITDRTLRSDLNSIKSINSKIVKVGDYYQFEFYDWRVLLNICIEHELYQRESFEISLSKTANAFCIDYDEMQREFANNQHFKFTPTRKGDNYHCRFIKDKKDRNNDKYNENCFFDLSFTDKKTNYSNLKIKAILNEFFQKEGEEEKVKSSEKEISQYLNKLTTNDNYITVLDWLKRKNLRTTEQTAIHSALEKVSSHLTTPSLNQFPTFFIWQIFKAIRDNTDLFAIFFSKRMSINNSVSDQAARLIQPHSLFFTESNWYVRAYEPDKFKDFRISRFALYEESFYKGKAEEPGGIDKDDLWNTEFSIQIIPSEKIEKNEKIFIWRDIDYTNIHYEIGEGDRYVPSLINDWQTTPKEYVVRESFVPYILNFLNVDICDENCKIELTPLCRSEVEKRKLFFPKK